MASITAANAIIVMSQATLFPTPFQLQGFGPDDVFDTDAIKSVETVMGVDGELSAGFVFNEVKQRFTLQADSAARDFFDVVYLQQQQAEDAYPINAVISLPAVAQKYTQTRGFITEHKLMPDAKKILQPCRYEITWKRIAVSPL
jgi:hypothetical protein